MQNHLAPLPEFPSIQRTQSDTLHYSYSMNDYTNAFNDPDASNIIENLTNITPNPLDPEKVFQDISSSDISSEIINNSNIQTASELQTLEKIYKILIENPCSYVYHDIKAFLPTNFVESLLNYLAINQNDQVIALKHLNHIFELSE